MSLHLYWAFVLGVFVAPCVGQTSKQFQWAFKDTALSTTLPTCVSFPIVVKSFNTTTNATNGVPPFYMISFAVGGTPVTTFIGEDENNLSWTVTQPAGSQLLLSVVDSTGGAGGIPPQLLQVVPGQTTQCVTTPLQPNPAFTVKANVSGMLETCQPWGITVTGGSPPYTITLAETNSPVVTNVTMPFGADRFTFPNRADPGGQLIAAISDLEGRWATGTPIVQPVGSTDTSCTGLVSTSGNATVIDAQDAALSAELNAGKRKKALVTGLVVILVFVLLLGFGGIGYLQYRKRQRIAREKAAERIPREFEQPPSEEVTSDTAVAGTSVPAAAGRGRGGLGVRFDEKRRTTSTPAGREANADLEAPPYQEIEPSPATAATPSGPGRRFQPLPLPANARTQMSLRLELPKLETSSLSALTSTPMRQITDTKRDIRPPKKPFALSSIDASSDSSMYASSPGSQPTIATQPRSTTAPAPSLDNNTTMTTTSLISASASGTLPASLLHTRNLSKSFATFPQKSIRKAPLRTPLTGGAVPSPDSMYTNRTPARSFRERHFDRERDASAFPVSAVSRGGSEAWITDDNATTTPTTTMTATNAARSIASTGNTGVQGGEGAKNAAVSEAGPMVVNPFVKHEEEEEGYGAHAVVESYQDASEVGGKQPPRYRSGTSR